MMETYEKDDNARKRCKRTYILNISKKRNGYYSQKASIEPRTGQLKSSQPAWTEQVHPAVQLFLFFIPFFPRIRLEGTPEKTTIAWPKKRQPKMLELTEKRKIENTETTES